LESNILIPIVAFLSTVTILGILLYRYLRQEQKKVIPEDTYNAARTEFHARKNRWLYNPTFASIVSRLLIFYSTFVVVVALSQLAMGLLNGNTARENIRLVLLSIVGSPLILFIFPIGIAALFAPESLYAWNFEGIVVGYILYLVICSPGIFVKDRRVFTILYLIFITLLIVNAVGCSRVSIPDL
jgi:hypothetical protein